MKHHLAPSSCSSFRMPWMPDTPSQPSSCTCVAKGTRPLRFKQAQRNSMTAEHAGPIPTVFMTCSDLQRIFSSFLIPWLLCIQRQQPDHSLTMFNTFQDISQSVASSGIQMHPASLGRPPRPPNWSEASAVASQCYGADLPDFTAVRHIVTSSRWLRHKQLTSFEYVWIYVWIYIWIMWHIPLN
jgi:hypothetical protein